MQINYRHPISFFVKVYQRVFLNYGLTAKFRNFSDEEAIKKFDEILTSSKPAMLCRFGSTEIQCVTAFLREKKRLRNLKMYKYLHWEDASYNMKHLSGFFTPNGKEDLIKFSQLMLEDAKQIDILGSWRKEEYYLRNILHGKPKVSLKCFDPVMQAIPWNRHLKGKKVLVIHPFEDTILKQYKNRTKLFDNKDVLPEFDLKTIKSVQTIAGNIDPRFKTWFDALEYMKSEINKVDFDIALIGCGAYGFPLAAHVKRIGKIGIHIGGSLQLMFGIFGKRWEERADYNNLKNEYWVYPSQNDIPTNSSIVEGGCYWK